MTRRVSLKKLEEFEALLKDEERVEIVIIDEKTDETRRVIEPRGRATARIIIRI